jgi:hypothetical protein
MNPNMTFPPGRPIPKPVPGNLGAAGPPKCPPGSLPSRPVERIAMGTPRFTTQGAKPGSVSPPQSNDADRLRINGPLQPMPRPRCWIERIFSR